MQKILIGFLALTLVSSCRFGLGPRITGSGVRVSESRDVNNFQSISSSGNFDVTITPSNVYSVTVSADDNVLKYVLVRKDGDRLVIRFRDNVRLQNTLPIRVEVSMPDLRNVSLSGSGFIKSNGSFTSDEKMKISSSGSGDIDLDLSAPTIESNIAGSGSITLKGKCRSADISIAGSGNYEAEKLLSEQTEISVAGSGDAHVFASITLDASIAGSGDITYTGGATDVKKKVAGSGSISPR